MSPVKEMKEIEERMTSLPVGNKTKAIINELLPESCWELDSRILVFCGRSKTGPLKEGVLGLLFRRRR